MPPENPYAAPQVIDQPVTILPELSEELVPSLESIRTGAQLSLKATWLVFLACVVVGVSAVLEIGEFVPLMLWILLGAAAFCFLFGLVAFWQVTPAAGIRGLMRIALIAFAISLLLSVVEGWVLPPRDRPARMASNALNNALSLAYSVPFLLGLARLGRVLQDRMVTFWATIAAWAWGAFYTLVGGTLLLGAVSGEVREQIGQFLTPQHRPTLVVMMSVVAILLLVGLVGFISALWRLRKLRLA